MTKYINKFPGFSQIRRFLLFILNYSKNHEIRKAYGSLNPDAVYYVIRNYTKEAGWGSILNYVCLQIGYALDNGYIPVIDMMNYPNAYLKKSELHKVNAWEKYFCQPSDISLNEVYSSKNVILCSSDLTHKGYISKSNPSEWKKYADIYNSNIKLLPNISKIIDNEINRVTGNRKLKVLGVLCRGTDYTNLKPIYHAIPFSATETIAEIKKIINDYDRIYLATEDQNVFDTFINEFSEKILFYTEQYRFNSDKVTGYLSETAESLNIDEYQKGLDYLKILYTLASCDSFIGAGCGGSYISALINNNNYSLYNILSKGIYQ